MEAVDTTKLTDAQVDSKLNHYRRIIRTLEEQARKKEDPDIIEKLKMLQVEWCYLQRESESRRNHRSARKFQMKNREFRN